ncbi:MAG: tRNA (adenosine(37)-N6)-threonylcarbamoyltransferase complex dimerization subunit type 1 TsaB [Blastocatellia bacterium]|nr:tRNA (adenosine(37)-N6)-threonylcarbamoyltransferase complex dimerization subunit type 1 TsaB [Blastocatellia bacterium]MCS7157153.1 tRNA (adenosine(37)-N6)-threonylcarbamoyltransferase complex dimerization subunit type 1 TsaB [Blastocatellia bacterium]MDW8167267.1 tRNA (adenosine(37)-N6)-threonylcarbamoyltransferase complex dimerization subunit type 1 TsaB [Acidobacteriota bacterium]
MILAIDTTSERGSIALQRGKELLAVLGSWRPGTHSQMLHEDIDFLLRRAGVTLERVSLLAVTIGPGSFTGVRVGIASIQGLAHALAKPVMGIGALEALAYGVGVSGTICACRDALRGEVYAQLFHLMADGELRALSEPQLMRPEALVAALEERTLIFVCEATASLRAELEEAARRKGHPLVPLVRVPHDEYGWVFVEPSPFLAPAVAALAARRFPQGIISEGATLDALYVRPADAEVRWRLRAGPLPD